MSQDQKYYADKSGLLVEDDVGPWAKRKLKTLGDYAFASGGARSRFKSAENCYIDIFCGPGRSRINTIGEVIDGSPLVAFKKAQDSPSPFSAVHLSDANPDLASSAQKRLELLGARVYRHDGPATSAVTQIVKRLDKRGLHFAFVDPYNLGNLSFSIFKEFSKFPSIDILVHVSLLDFRRNADRYSSKEAKQFDDFAPDWREHIDEQKHNSRSLRTEIFNFWSAKVESLGLPRAKHYERVSAPGGQQLYWLMLLSGHSLAHTLFERIGSEWSFPDMFE